MDRRFLPSPESQKYSGSFVSALARALLEWMLIFMLFVHAIFGYLITKFAHYSELPIPCLLCSRIDHILGSEKVGYYCNLICGYHKLEISSLVFCHFHEKLVDVNGMCETCLFSFATKDKSNAETYRLLVGKLGAEDLDRLNEDQLLDDHKPNNTPVKRCSCCNELWTSRHHAQKLLETMPSGFGTSDLDTHLNHKYKLDVDNLNKEVKTLYHSEARTHVRGVTEDSTIDLGYSPVNIMSDTELDSEVSDNEERRALISSDPLRDLLLDSTQMEPFVGVAEDEFASNRPRELDVLSSQHSEALCQVQSETVDPCVGPSTASTRAFGHGLEELNWQEVDVKHDQPAPAELINFDHVPEPSNEVNVSAVFPTDGLSVKEAETLQTSANEEIDKSQDLETSQITSDLSGLKMNSDSKSNNNDNGLQMLNDLDLGGAYKLAVGNRGRQLSSKLTEQLAGKDSNVVSGDLMLLLSQLSRGVDFPLNDILSPRVSRNPEELKTHDSSASVGMKLLQKRLSLERNDSRNSLDRNESGFESLENFSTVSEVEGESEVDQLKRQLEHDRKIMIVLLKELEEERNASAIAANETMAMITRLQEEKAALQMEALQDLRIMEEQGEYDMEALEKLNDLVTEKDKEIQDLEAEIEYFHLKYPDESFLEDTGELVWDSKGSWLDIGDEREYMLQHLSSLEKKLDNMVGNQRENSYDSISHEECGQVKSELDENNVTSQKDDFLSKKSPRTFVRRSSSFKIPKSQGSLVHKEEDLVALSNEVSNLNDRLQALEADRNFIERVIGTHKNGEKGLIHEIVSHLRELRRSGIKRHKALS